MRQGDTVRREVILLACHRPSLDRLIGIAEQSGLRPVAVDVEPVAMLRCYGRQFRRDDDLQRHMMFVTVGASNTVAVIARGTDTMFVKYIDIGGRHFDEAVAKGLKMTPGDAAALTAAQRRPPGAQRDAEIARSLDEAVRPVLDRLGHELSLCLRYYSVTFRGQPLQQMVLGGGEATELLAEWLSRAAGTAVRGGEPVAALPADGAGRPRRPVGHRHRIGIEGAALTCTTSTSYRSNAAENTSGGNRSPG